MMNFEVSPVDGLPHFKRKLFID